MGCRHLSQIRHVGPRAAGCEECLATGQEWVSLRLCLSCGHVGCCDSSPGRHARAHHEQSKHPIIRSFGAGDDWAWCYPDESFLDTEAIDQALEAGHRHECRRLAAEAADLEIVPHRNWLHI
ncbi:MAG TPA: UBP-type zinc finger domain-containing protein [Vulgatibacter sp.]|nr:UBP-type zinc finger domain-containing protein [Vulgatibacter sp.]